MMIFKPAGLMPRLRESGEELRSTLSKRRRGKKTTPGDERDEVPQEHQAPSLLELKNVRLSFGGVTAVAGFDATVEAGKITALIGPNGAGKTTLFNLITGIYKPETGTILFKGKNIAGLPPHVIAAQGIARTFQNIRIFPSLTCLENVLCGQHCRGRAEFTGSLFHVPSQREEEKAMLDFSLRCLDRVGLGESMDKLAASLPYGKRRSLEIARALALCPDLLVLDEPSSGLNDVETEELARLLLSLLQEGLSILLIEHDMHLVDMVSDHVIVMQSGRIIAEGTMRDMRKNPLVIEAYLGTEED
jgi:ABC-type branched-subunit amino acid transport system ATPase component